MASEFTLHSESGELAAPAGASPTGAPTPIRFARFTEGAFGLQRLLLSTSGDARRQLASLSLQLDGRYTVIEAVSVHLLQRFFSRRALTRPVQIAANEQLTLTAYTTDAAGAGTLRAAVQGYDAEGLSALVRASEGTRSPVLLAKTATIPAGATTHRVSFDGRGTDLILHRMLAATETAAADERVSLALRSDRADQIEAVSPIQLETLFMDDVAQPPVRLPGNRPFVVEVDNPTGAPVELSVLFETYPA